mmetsp:Transcript_5248/g.7738  ORF Transcript_5248/g.7738 Transcript_5248/m.7738 type:complete len:407 (-) Transcript_5248:65-1285(-)
MPLLFNKDSSFGATTAASTLRGCSTGDCYPKTATQSRRVLFAPPLLSSENYNDPKTIVLKTKDTPPSTTNNLHVVYFFLDPQNAKSSYDVNYDMLQAIILHNQKTLASSSSSWQTHVITSNDKIIELLSDNNYNKNNNSNKNQIQVIDYRKLPVSKRVQRFQNIYISQSSNNIEYESFCMWRWIVIAEYFESLVANGIPVANILALDTDVLLVEDPLLIVKDVDWNVVQSFRVINGAAMMWTLPGLETFVTFLLDLYADGAKMAVELAKQHGSIHPQCYKPGSLLLPCFPTNTDQSNENNIQQDYSMWHISDMEWYRAWSRQNLSLRLTRPDPHLISCYVISHIDEDHSFRFVRLGSDHVLASPANDEQALKRVCFLHFQGEAKEAVFPFLSFLEGDSHEYFLPPR